MTGPVLSFLGETHCELGPAADASGHPWRHGEADGIRDALLLQLEKLVEGAAFPGDL